MGAFDRYPDAFPDRGDRRGSCWNRRATHHLAAMDIELDQDAAALARSGVGRTTVSDPQVVAGSYHHRLGRHTEGQGVWFPPDVIAVRGYRPQLGSSVMMVGYYPDGVSDPGECDR
jgi:hypothetical protein